MSISISNLSTGQRTKRSYSSWADILELASKYGWSPAGTQVPSELGYTEWGGGYNTSDFQRITESDALNLATALRRVVDIDLSEVIEILEGGGEVRLS